MLFADLVAASAEVGSTTKRLAKVATLAAALDAMRGDAPASIEAGAAYLAGELRQRQIGVGYAALTQLPAAASTSTLTVADVDSALADIGEQSGPGSTGRRRDRLDALLSATTEAEQWFLVRLIGGELRQGAQAGLLVDAIAKASNTPTPAVRRALLLAGDLKVVARVALTGGPDALAEFTLTPGRPLTPMLAQAAPSVADALAVTGLPAVVDTKLDGIRIQVHRAGGRTTVYTRSLDDITTRLPGVVAAVAALDVSDIVLDGEAIALDDAGRPRPFQETSAAAATAAPGTDDELVVAGAALKPYFFDLLHLDGLDLIDEPGERRWAELGRVLPASMIVDRVIAADEMTAAAAFEAAIAAGHEGVVVKAPVSAYDVGRRGGAWVKVKPRHTLDLVVMAVERGHGRRSGWLSNLHLGARDPEGGGFVMLGKTFKGMTDEMLRWQTERLGALAVDPVGPEDWVVVVRPELVVEIAFDGVQTSPRYPGGVALRFARVLRYREDKRADEADTIETVRKLQVA